MTHFNHIKIVAQNTLLAFQMIPESGKVLAAVSGGADSVLLALIMKDLGLLHGIAHCNYQLRGDESDSEERFVQQLADELSVPFYCRKLETRSHIEASGQSLQVVARNLRYDFFEMIMEKEGLDVCATAHHQNDQAETILMNFIKGYSPEITKGIPFKRGKFIRPLLKVSRIEIENALKDKNQSYCTDSSNLKDIYFRNKLRNNILPVLETLNPSLGLTLENKLAQYTLQTGLIKAALTPYLTEGNELNFNDFITDFGTEFLPLLIQAFLEKHQIYGLIIEQITALTEKETGKFVPVDSYRKIVRSRSGISLIEEDGILNSPVQIPFFQGERSFSFDNQTIIIENPCEDTPVFGKENVFYIDAEKIKFPLTIRKKQEGDTMIPFGMRGEKKLSDIMTDEKFTPFQKQNALVFTDCTQKIFAFSGFRISENVAIRKHTRIMMKIEVKNRTLISSES